MRRREGIAKLSGRERYVDDVPLEDFLWAGTVRSPVARGKIRKIRFGPGVDWSEFTVVDHRDIQGRNAVYLKSWDQPALAADTVRHVHEPVLLLAHPSRDAVRRAVRSVEVVVDPEPAYLDYRLPPRPEQVQHGDDNVFKRLLVEKGDVDAALARAAHVVEGTFETGAQEHVYLEPQGMLAYVEGEVLVVRGSMQCPFFVVHALMPALGRSEAEVRVVHVPTGGGFGGKEEFPSMVAIHAALLTLKSGRPVKLVYDRDEDLAATTKRHPATIRHRTGLDRDGRLVAQEIDVLVDAGAYITLSPVVLSRAVIHAGGPYRCDNVRITGRAVLTNAVPFGAFRGFGNPQVHFAGERHMDVLARELGWDPVELRRRNLLRDGDEMSTGQTIHDGVDREALLDLAVERLDLAGKRSAHARFNANHPTRRRGAGVAVYHHGAGFTGAGEVHLQSELHVEGLPDGRVSILSASIEMGQGTLTIFTQLATERLGLEPDDILIAEADTHRVPNSGPTVASRTAMVVGRLLERACDDLRERLGLPEEARGDAVRQAIAGWHRDRAGERLLGTARYEPPGGVQWDEEMYRGDAYAAYGWAAHAAEVEVDLRTCEIRVVDYVAVSEVGKVLNETLARGQIQGGVVQGIGWALQEECKFREGAMINNQLTNYIIPTSADVPPIRTEFVEVPCKYGPRGAKGLGELPIEGPAPAILNAVAAAVGAEPRRVPLTPERLLELLSPPDAADADLRRPA